MTIQNPQSIAHTMQTGDLIPRISCVVVDLIQGASNLLHHTHRSIQSNPAAMRVNQYVMSFLAAHPTFFYSIGNALAAWAAPQPYALGFMSGVIGTSFTQQLGLSSFNAKWLRTENERALFGGAALVSVFMGEHFRFIAAAIVGLVVGNMTCDSQPWIPQILRRFAIEIEENLSPQGTS